MVDRLEGRQPARRGATLGVVAVPVERLKRIPDRTLVLILAAGRHDVHDHAGAERRRRVGATELDLDVLHRIAAHPHRMGRGVDVGGRRRALELERVCVDVRPAEIIRASADAIIDVSGPDARRHIERVAEQPARGDGSGAQQFAFDVHDAGRPANFDHRRVTCYGDGFSEVAHLHLDINRERRPRPHDDAFAAVGRKASQFRRDRVGAWRKVKKPVVTGRVGYRGHRRQQRRAGCRYGDPGQHRALLILDVSAQATVGLRLYRRGRHNQHDEHHCEASA